MAKAILMSIQPKWVAKILNGEKTIEVRKKFPKDYVGWVYIYCTKAKGTYLYGDKSVYEGKRESFWCQRILGNGIVPLLNGKVVARFWCDNVDVLETEFYKEEPLYDEKSAYQAVKRICLEQLEIVDYDEDWCDREELYTNEDYLNEKEEKNNKFLQKCCLSGKELQKYFNKIDRGYAIYISRLEVFDKPKELKEFYFQENCANCPHKKYCKAINICKHDLQKAPQSWCYVEDKL